MSLLDIVLNLLLPARREAKATGVRSGGRDELQVSLGGRRYWVYSELQGKGPVAYVVELDSVKDITDHPQIVDAPRATPEVATAVITQVRRYFEVNRIRVRYE